jgi:uncharacterized RDD family membrane protein YckC
MGRVLGGLLPRRRERVADRAGRRRLGIYRATIRSVLRLLVVNPLLFGGAPAGVVVCLTKTRQRLGDMVARTFVLKKTDLPRLLD